MLFTESSTRCEFAEKIPVEVARFTPRVGKHGLDGLPSPYRNEYAEVKAATAITARGRASICSITVNDPSNRVLENYDRFQPVLLFPIIIDGYLTSMISIKWKYLRDLYVSGIERISLNNQKKKTGSSASRNFNINTVKYLDVAQIEFLYPHSDTCLSLLKAIKAPKKYIQFIEAAYEERTIKHRRSAA